MAHYEAVRAAFPTSTILYCFENNLGKEQDHLEYLVTHVARINNASVLSENPAVVGFHTLPKTRLQADDRLQDMVTMNGVCFAESLIGINPNPAKSAEHMRTKLIAQIGDMREYVKQTPKGDATRVVTSLFSEDYTRIRGKQDDLQRALSLLLWASSKFLTRRLPVDYNTIIGLQAKRTTLRPTLDFHRAAGKRLADVDKFTANKRANFE